MKWQYTHLPILLPSFTLNVSKVEKSLFSPSTREKVSARNPVRQLESGTVPPSRHHVESGIRYLRRLFPDEAALDCHADEREAWDGALVKKGAVLFFVLLSQIFVHFELSFAVLSICTMKLPRFTGPLSVYYT
uniref:Uncharacterized protein n=1 Tax=Rhipicephalus microplus TaxID=6941 RepID=A0A6G5AG38_RHIMP